MALNLKASFKKYDKQKVIGRFVRISLEVLDSLYLASYSHAVWTRERKFCWVCLNQS